MTKVFISGSMSIKNLDQNVRKRIDNIIHSGFGVILGDADGVDSSIQEYLLSKKVEDVTVYCSGPQPRNNLGRWKIVSVKSTSPEGTRGFFTAKDIRLASDANYGLMVWDAKSTGTLSNVIELLSQKKKSLVYINKQKLFLNVSFIDDLEKLVTFMSPAALEKAEGKIGLKQKIQSLKFQQSSLF